MSTTTISSPFAAAATALAPGALHKLQSQGRARLEQLGYPGPRDEAWRFTPLAQTLTTSWQVAGADADYPAVPDFALNGYRVILRNGRVDLKASKLPEAASVSSFATLADAPVELNQLFAESAQSFAALNASAAVDGVVIRVPAGVTIDAPIHLVHLMAGEDVSAHPRHLIVAERGSACTVVESCFGVGTYVANPATEIFVAESATVNHVRLQQDSMTATHLGLIAAQVAGDATLHSYAVSLGAALSRTEIDVVMTAPGGHVGLHGLYSAKDKQVADFHTSLDHAHPDCTSEQMYKGVLDDRGRGVFAGRIMVRQDAQRTAAMQTNRALLLSDDAKVNTMPQLEIFADDVSCTHGATIGELDEKALFYMQSRGIDEASARSILTYAFADEAIIGLPVDVVRRYIESQLTGHEEGMTA